MSIIIRWQYCIVSGDRPYRAKLIVLMALIGGIAFSSAGVMAKNVMLGPLDLSPLQSPLTEPQAKHLASRAGFGATIEEIAALVGQTPNQALQRFVNSRKDDLNAPVFQHSGIFDEGLDPFPPSRPATTELAKRQGNALGIEVKPDGNRPLQPIVNKFFYWLRASRLETDRIAYWWANRMLTSEQPLREKAALFWHGHFATNEDKVRDYRKMLLQVQTFQRLGLANFRDLLIAMAQDPAMLVFLDAGVNTKDAPNENFAREIMELFTMGVGEYGEEDVREAARAFTGWSVKGLEFHIDPETHDAGAKDFLGEQGHFDGIEIIDRFWRDPKQVSLSPQSFIGTLCRMICRPPQKNSSASVCATTTTRLGISTELFVSQIFMPVQASTSRARWS